MRNQFTPDESTNEPARDRARMLKEFQDKLILKAAEESKPSEDGELKSELDEVNPFLSLKETLTYAKLFREEFKLENMPTKALMVIEEEILIDIIYCFRFSAACWDFSLTQFGEILFYSCGKIIMEQLSVHCLYEDAIIPHLSHHILRLQREDREIMWEGVDSLTHEELSEACKERAMRFYGVSDDVMRDQMRQWLELSSRKDIPPLLLLWSRSITMTHSMKVDSESSPIEIKAIEINPTVVTPVEAVSDELLPVVEEVVKKSVEEAKEEERLQKEEQLKGLYILCFSIILFTSCFVCTVYLSADLEKADKRLEELRSEAELLEKETEGILNNQISSSIVVKAHSTYFLLTPSFV